MFYNAFKRCGEPSYDICGEPSKAVASLPILWRTFPVANLPCGEHSCIPQTEWVWFKARCFVKLKKSEKNSGVGGWVFQAPTRICLFFGNCVFFLLWGGLHVSQIFFKMHRGRGGWEGSGQYEFFSNFCIFFNLTRPLTRPISITQSQSQ